MSSPALGLILLGSVVQILAIIFFAVMSETVRVLPLVVAISVGSAIEVLGILMLSRRRR